MSNALRTEPSVAIIIPSKNRREDIERCLRSIQAQPAKPDQVIVVDQSASAYQLPATDNLTHLYMPEVNGLARARNIGIQHSNSDIVLFLDDDCELLNDCVTELRRAFRQHPDAVAIQCNIGPLCSPLSFYKLHRMLFARGFFNSDPIYCGHRTELRFVAVGAAAIRSDLFRKELFDEGLTGYCFGEDWEFSKRASRHGRLLLAPNARIRHHLSSTNRVDLSPMMEMTWVNFLYFYDKLEAKRFLPNRFWRVWWMFGECLRWLKYGLGLPPLRTTRGRLQRAPHHR